MATDEGTIPPQHVKRLEQAIEAAVVGRGIPVPYLIERIEATGVRRTATEPPVEPIMAVPEGVGGSAIEHAQTAALGDMARGWFRDAPEQAIRDCAEQASCEYLLERFEGLLESYKRVYMAAAQRLLALTKGTDGA